MSQRRRLALVLGALAATFALGVIATVKLAERHAARRLAARQPITVDVPARVGDAQAGGTARHRLSATQVLHAFAASYLAYLDGGPGSALRYASITAASQATGGGQIPPAFRDGPLRITDAIKQGSTGWSAQATVLVSNRSESYPFTVQMLYEQDGWQIAQVVPVDLSIDDHTRPPVGVVVSAAGVSAARRFAVAYVDYRAGVTRSLPAMSSAAREAIAQGTDSLAQTRMPRERAGLESISYGPPSGGEFAATATVTVAGRRETFSFLMVLTRAGWVCGAFL
ncbi:MAG: hypothetical protein ACLP50_02135 [Solirubrobacteraceae bacterium]